MHKIILPLLILAPLPALAQQQPSALVLIPRATAEAARDWIAAPNPDTAVRLFARLAACIADNPQNGRTTRVGRDQCPAVTEALAAQAKALAGPQKAAAP